MSKVLLVDDDADIAEVVEIILTTHGFKVVKIFDGSQVFDTLTNFQPDVILLDVNIGEVDGREVCKKLKATHSPHNHIPVLLFSAMHDLSNTYPECKATDFISKPFDSLELLNKLKKYAIRN